MANIIGKNADCSMNIFFFTAYNYDKYILNQITVFILAPLFRARREMLVQHQLGVGRDENAKVSIIFSYICTEDLCC